jgi:protein TonB
MAFELLDNRNRAIGVAAALGVNALLVALLLTLSNGLSRNTLGAPGLTTFDVTTPPPPPPPKPDSRPAAAAAPPSRGATKAPSPPNPPRPLPTPSPAQPAIDAGSQSASGAGSAAGTGAGQGGRGDGTGSGAGGNGTGSGKTTPPVHIAGALTNADYARSGVPKGAGGTVVIGFRVRSDGRVDNCSVVRSSGVPTIDSATCRLFEQRFRFRPALDAAGRPIDFNLRTDFTWRPR